jgi:hypothetical protein
MSAIFRIITKSNVYSLLSVKKSVPFIFDVVSLKKERKSYFNKKMVLFYIYFSLNFNNNQHVEPAFQT